MENLLILGIAVLICLAVIVREYYIDNSRKRKLIKSLYENYGKGSSKKHSLERFSKIDSYYLRHEKEGQIDDITWNDLNMDDIFKKIDTTCSASGEEYLYYRLRTAMECTDEREHFEKILKLMDSNADLRVRIQYILSRLGHTGKYSIYDYLENLESLGKRSNIKHFFVDCMILLSLFILPFNISVGICVVSVLMVYNIVVYFSEKNEIDPYIVSFAYVARLLDAADELKKLNISELNEENTVLSNGLARLGAIRRNSWFIFSGNKYNTSSNPLDIIADYIKMALHIDLIQFNRMLKKLITGESEIDEMISVVGFLDTVIAVASFRASLHSWCIPEIGDFDICEITDCFHPLLSNPVKNSVKTDRGRGILITGSNASGKSTFLRTVALNILMAQNINTCTANSYIAPMCRLYSSMSLKDNINSGESYYIVEIKSIKRILDAASEGNMPIICFVDEVLRGTNTVERVAASTEILSSLAGGKVTCFAATHDIELTSLLEKCYDNYHFEEEISEGDIYFPYKLMEGKAKGANAIKLLDIMGYDKKITERAYKRAGGFVETGKWEALDWD